MVIPCKTIIIFLSALHLIVADIQPGSVQNDSLGGLVQRIKRQLPMGHVSFDNQVRNYRAMANDRREQRYHFSDLSLLRNYPYLEVIERTDFDAQMQPIGIPVYLRATITSAHVLPARFKRPAHPGHIVDYIQRLGAIEGRPTVSNDPEADQVGHLLCLALGGTNDYSFNFSPQTARLNTHPCRGWSLWLGEERAMISFLRGRPGRRIEWELLIVYGSEYSNSPQRLRPVSFVLRHTNYNNNVMVNNQNQPINQRTPVMTFGNDAGEECRYTESM